MPICPRLQQVVQLQQALVERFDGIDFVLKKSKEPAALFNRFIAYEIKITHERIHQYHAFVNEDGVYGACTRALVLTEVGWMTSTKWGRVTTVGWTPDLANFLECMADHHDNLRY